MTDCNYGYHIPKSIRSDNKIYDLVVKKEKYTPDEEVDNLRRKGVKYLTNSNSKGKEKGSSNQDNDAGCCTSMS